ncbi:unnamed protein product [Closterium sp. NIES-64]|nr:unnamed protein product [Closterium sp. NIES-64]
MDGKNPSRRVGGPSYSQYPSHLGSSFASLHRSTRTPARTPAESKPAAGSSSTCRRASPRLPRDVAVALTPTLSSSSRSRAPSHITRRRILLRVGRPPWKPARKPRSKHLERRRHADGRRGTRRIRRVASCIGDEWSWCSCCCSPSQSSSSCSPPCGSLTSLAFTELPPWHFPVALLKLLDERHSRQNSAHRGKQRGGLGKMHAVVYSAGCKALVPAAVAANRRQRMGQGEEDLRRGGVEDKMVGKDGWESWKWRTKLVMDFIYVARQCLATRPKYVLLLQDDTLPAKLYDVGIERFVKEDLTHKSWGVVSLYNPQSYNWGHQHGDEYSVPCCAQALLFNVTALEGMLQYMEEHLMETNMDLLVNKYLNVSGIKGYVHVPSPVSNT